MWGYGHDHPDQVGVGEGARMAMALLTRGCARLFKHAQRQPMHLHDVSSSAPCLWRLASLGAKGVRDSLRGGAHAGVRGSRSLLGKGWKSGCTNK